MNQVELEQKRVYNQCHVCNGEGVPGGCPRCGLEPGGVKRVKKLSLSIGTDIIPEIYQGKVWEKPESDVLRFQQFDQTLEKVYNIFLNGELPIFSLFIAAPPKYGKFLFAYACMQAALMQNLRVAPMFTISDWRRLYRVSQMNPMYKLYKKYRWDDLVTHDVVFITIDDSEDRYDAIGMMKTIYDVRATMSLPTFIISDYKLTSLVSRYQGKEYTKIYNPDNNRDYKRYPVILHRFTD